MRKVFFVLGLIVAFAVGSASGYAARVVVSPAAQTGHSAAACPAGSHPVVWYTAQTWECVSD